MAGLLDLLKSRNGQTATGGLLGLAAGGPVGLLAGAAGGRLLGGIVREGQRRNTAAEQALEARALEITGERQRQAAVTQQREAMAALPGLLSAPLVADGMVGPPRPGAMRATDQRQGLMTALTQLAPQQAAQGLLGQMTPPRRSLRGTAGLLQAQLGRVPTMDEVVEAERALADAKGEDMSDVLDSLRARDLIGQIEDREADREDEAEAEAVADATESVSLSTLAAEAEDVLGKLETLESEPFSVGTDSAIQSGSRLVTGILGGAQDLMGEPNQFSKSNATSDAFDKSLAALRNAAVSLTVPEGATNQERRDAQDAFPTREMQPGAIRAGVARLLQTVIDNAEATGADADALKRLRDVLEKAQTTDGVEVEFD